MQNLLTKLIEKISSDDVSIKATKKLNLINYLLNKIGSKIVISQQDDLESLYEMIKDFNYDSYKLNKYLNMAYDISNNSDNETENRPKLSYAYNLYQGLKKINYNIDNHNSNSASIRFSLHKSFHRFNPMLDREKLNGEISIIDLTNKIVASIENKKNKNYTIINVLSGLDKIDRGLLKLENKPENVFSSPQLMELFSNNIELRFLGLDKIVTTYYPVFNNDLFSLIAKAYNQIPKNNFNNNTLMEYLSNCHKAKDEEEHIENKLRQELLAIDLKKKDDLIKQLNNEKIDTKIRKKIITNVENVYDQYIKIQDENISEKLGVFYENVSFYINSILINQQYKNKEIDELVASFSENMKDFFFEYDGKKFKAILDYLNGKTKVEIKEFNSIKDTCHVLFKEGSIEKLKSVNKNLKEFTKFINKSIKNDINYFDYDIFSNLIMTKPELVMNDDYKHIISFFKKELSLKDFGYKGEDFHLPIDILSYEFFKRITIDEPEVFFNSSMEKLVTNITFVKDICGNLNINFRNLEINEDFVYFLLKTDFVDIDYSVTKLNRVFNQKEIKTILENNPNILLMKEQDLDILIHRTLVNATENHDCKTLLSSDLFYYDSKDYNENKEQLLNRPFKLVNYLNNDNLLTDLEILTSGVVIDDVANDIMNHTKIREKKIGKIRELIAKATADQIDSDDFIVLINDCLSLYNSSFPLLPNINIINDLETIINKQLEEIQEQKRNSNDELSSQEEMLEIYAKEEKDASLLKKEISKLKGRFDSESVKKEVDIFLTSIDEKRVSSSKEKKKIDSHIDQIKKALEGLNEHTKKLEKILDEEIHINLDFTEEYNPKNSFTIGENVNNEEEVTTIDEVLDGENVIIFDDSIDLEDALSDRHFVEKIHKFLGKNDLSLISREFLQTNMNNVRFLERYSSYRSKICARRENNTQVRIYFIKIINKHFPCLYITGVNTKNHDHIYAGIEDDAVYANKLKFANDLEEKIQNMSEEEAIEFIKKYKKEYKKKMKPIEDRYISNCNKKGNKKS